MTLKKKKQPVKTTTPTPPASAADTTGVPAAGPARTPIEIATIKPHPLQNVYYMTSDAKKLRELADDIQRNGLRQPVEVMPAGNQAGLPANTLIDGHDRVEAAKLLGWTHIDAIVREDLREAEQPAVDAAYLTANLQRKHLDKLDQARAVVRLYELEKQREPGRLRNNEANEARDRVGERIGMSGRNLQRYWNTLLAPIEVQRALQAGHIKLVDAARTGLLSAQQKEMLAQQLRGLTGRAEIQAVMATAPKAYPDRPPNAANALARFARTIQRALTDLDGREDEVRPAMVREYLDAFAAARAMLTKLIEKGRSAKTPPKFPDDRNIDPFAPAA